MNKKMLQGMVYVGLILFLVGCNRVSVARSTPMPPTPTAISYNSYVKSFAELSTVQGPADGIASIALKPDGSILAYGNYTNNSVTLINVSNGETLMILDGHTAAVTSLAFSSDGNLLASVGSVNSPPEKDGSVIIWDLKTGQKLATFQTAGTNQLAFSPDGALLAGAGGGDPVQIRLWDVKTLAEKSVISNVFSALAFSPDGNLLASASRDELVHIIEVSSGKEVKSLAGHTSMIGAVAFNPMGTLLASGSSDKIIQLWDVNTGAKSKSLTGHESSVDFLAFSPDGSTLASLGSGLNVTFSGGQVSISITSGDQLVRFWDIETGSQIWSIKTDDNIDHVCFSSNWTLMATGSPKGVIRFWSVKP